MYLSSYPFLSSPSLYPHWPNLNHSHSSLTGSWPLDPLWPTSRPLRQTFATATNYIAFQSETPPHILPEKEIWNPTRGERDMNIILCVTRTWVEQWSSPNNEEPASRIRQLIAVYYQQMLCALSWKYACVSGSSLSPTQHPRTASTISARTAVFTSVPQLSYVSLSPGASLRLSGDHSRELNAHVVSRLLLVRIELWSRPDKDGIYISGLIRILAAVVSKVYCVNSGSLTGSRPGADLASRSPRLLALCLGNVRFVRDPSSSPHPLRPPPRVPGILSLQYFSEQ